MYCDKTVAVVVPCYNEESQIENVIDTLPDYVDRIIVVDDGSADATSETVMRKISRTGGAIEIAWRQPVTKRTSYNQSELVYEQLRAEQDTRFPEHHIVNDNVNDRIVLIKKPNGGVGTAISVGYKWCRDHLIDVTVVAAGDGQMDPGEMESLIKPVVLEGVEYTKGNRLIHRAAFTVIPRKRLFGNAALSLLTKIASGYWRISDSQTGYTAIALSALESIQIHSIYKSYGCPNDILIKLNISNCTIREVPIKPVYGVGERSKMKIKKVIPAISILLIKGYVKRILYKYFMRDFHPLSLLYIAGFAMTLIDIPFFTRIMYRLLVLGSTSPLGEYIAFLLLTLFSFQSLCFAMWMDMQDNDRLHK